VPARILVVEDDANVREAVGLVLTRAGFDVAAVSDGPSALAAVADLRPDLVVLDLMLPGMDGFTVCRRLRSSSTASIIILTARADTADVVTGLELGADDYVTKPFDSEELAARVRAVIRRGSDPPASLDFRDLHIDEVSFRAFKSGAELPLTATEMRLLIELVREAGSALTREALLQRVWGYDYLGDSRLVDMAIKRLRDKLGEPPEDPQYITTVRGVGYRLENGSS
jgi:two-component system response regulator MtrA